MWNVRFEILSAKVGFLKQFNFTTYGGKAELDH